MNIVVAVRCYNEEKHIKRFLDGYAFADHIVISDGGSTDNSVELIKSHYLYGESKIQLLNFDVRETVNGHTWNPDHPHMNFVLDAAKELKPNFLLFDDMDDIPNKWLRLNAKHILSTCDKPQINAFRLYLWGDDKYFPWMNRDLNPLYRSVWGWKPSEIDIHADPSVRHGTLVGLTDNHCGLDAPYCLLHKSYGPDTIEAKLARYNAVGLTMLHPLETNGPLKELPEWATE